MTQPRAVIFLCIALVVSAGYAPRAAGQVGSISNTFTPGERPCSFGDKAGTLSAATFLPQRFKLSDDRNTLLADGFLSATCEVDGVPHSITRQPVSAVPVKVPRGKPSGGAGLLLRRKLQQEFCEILRLDLGPLHLDLLGLVIDLNEIHLTIRAEPGAGNLLGNLLCAVANLLNGPGSLAPLSVLLNRILGLLGLLG